jgi:hypothetical protein
MDYSTYMRKKRNTISRTIGFQNGQDASQVTFKNQAKAQSVHVPVPVETSFSKIGGTVGNIMEATQQTSSPTKQTCSSGYRGVSDGIVNADKTANVMGAKQHCAVCSDAPSSAPYNIVIPCGIFIDPVSYDPVIPGTTTNVPPTFPTPGNAPGKTVCCSKDMSQLYRNNSELIADQGRQLALRRAYNLPSKLQSLRGPIVNRG